MIFWSHVTLSTNLLCHLRFHLLFHVICFWQMYFIYLFTICKCIRIPWNNTWEEGVKMRYIWDLNSICFDCFDINFLFLTISITHLRSKNLKPEYHLLNNGLDPCILVCWEKNIVIDTYFCNFNIPTVLLVYMFILFSKYHLFCFVCFFIYLSWWVSKR